MVTGDSGCEAYTAIAWGVGLSHERSDIAGAESSYSLESNMCAVPTYAFATPVLGGQLALSMASAIGRVQASVDDVAYDRQQGYNDVLPSATLRWNSGVNNYLAYAQGEIPIGTYDPLRLANFGMGTGVSTREGATHISIRRPATNSRWSPA